MEALFGITADKLNPPDILIESEESENLPFHIKMLHTPGHSRGGVCYLLEDHIFSGDTLFAGSIGRTDLPGGDMRQIEQSLKRLQTLPGDCNIYPGHGPSSVLGVEKETNPYLLDL